MCMLVFGGARINFDRITASNLVILGNFLHCRVWNLCNQLVLQFSMDHFETMHTCCGNSRCACECLQTKNNF